MGRTGDIKTGMRFSLAMTAMVALLLGCSDSSDSGASGSAGQAGASGSAGAAGASATGGTSGSGGASGTAGVAGTGGSAGSGGTAGVDPCGELSSTWTRCATNPLWQAGFTHTDGRFELSIGDPDVFFDPDDGLWKAWWSTGLAAEFTGPEEDIQMGIKYAESVDGVTWVVQEKLAFEARSSTDDWDQLKLETPSVLKVPNNPPDRRYMLVYSGAQKTKPVYTAGVANPPVDIVWYQIGLAFSADGKSFTRLPAAESPYFGQTIEYPSAEGLLLQGKDAFPGMAGVTDGIVADPELLLVDGTIHLFFSSMPVDASGQPLSYGVSHATSTDGVHFEPTQGNPVFFGAGQPSVIQKSPGQYEIFFIEDTDEDKAQEPSTFNPFLGLWRSSSTDLVSWTDKGTTRDFLWDGSQPTETYGIVATGDVAYKDGVYRLYYPGWSTTNVPDGFLCPLRDGTFPAAVIVLNLARRN